MKTLALKWNRFDINTPSLVLAQRYCLYVFYLKADGDRPFYIGKARHFGPRQASGYMRSARYNAGYLHLVDGLLRAGYVIYTAEIGEDEFRHAEQYEQELIHLWQPIRVQRTNGRRKSVCSPKPWA